VVRIFAVDGVVGMRFLKMFFMLLVLLLVTSGLMYVVWVEVTVRYGAWDLRKEMEKVTILAANPNQDHFSLCQDTMESIPDPSQNQKQEQGTPVYPLTAYQMRFVSVNSFVIEVVCNRKPEKIVEIANGSLTRGLIKTQGSGIYVPIRTAAETYADITAAVAITYGYRTLGVGVYSGTLAWKTEPEAALINIGTSIPKTSCAGWGSYCCTPALEVGEGMAETRAVDCPGACYSHCGQRPVLVFFNSDPLLDFKTRTLTLYGQTVDVTFGYEMVDADNAINEVVIDYGDGEQYVSSADKGLVNHTYQCVSPECVYYATIAATDVLGYTLGESRNARLTVIVKTQ
jgi:hypothetical protein